MASSFPTHAIPFLLTILVLILTSTFLPHTHSLSIPKTRLVLTHIYSSRSPTPSKLQSAPAKQIIADIIARDISRAYFMAQKLAESQRVTRRLPVLPGTHPTSGIYTVSMGFGTPAVEFPLMLDTGSDLTWIPCTDPSNALQNSTLLFHPTFSSSYRVVPCRSPVCASAWSSGCTLLGCNYHIMYADGTFSNGTLSMETLTVVADRILDYVFGCSNVSGGFDDVEGGLLGMGRSRLGFPSQSSSFFSNTFSYCLPLLRSNTTGYMDLGAFLDCDILNVYVIPLVHQLEFHSSYFVGLREILVNSVRIQVNNLIGTILDSGSTFTRLELSIYENLRVVFVQQTIAMGGPQPIELSPVDGLDTCYSIESGGASKFPSIALFFEGIEDGLVLPYENILIEAENDVACLAFISTLDRIGVIGGYQQQGFGVGYDLPGSRVGFAHAMC